jgi:hypothetical protein
LLDLSNISNTTHKPNAYRVDIFFPIAPSPHFGNIPIIGLLLSLLNI